MARVRLDDDVLNAAREALAQLRDTSANRIDQGIHLLPCYGDPEPADVVLTAYWVGDLARVDVKAARGKG